MYIDKSDDIVDEYNNTYRTIKMKPVNFIEYNVSSSDKDPKFQVGDNVRILNIKTFLLKDIPKMDPKKFFD